MWQDEGWIWGVRIGGTAIIWEITAGKERMMT